MNLRPLGYEPSELPSCSTIVLTAGALGTVPADATGQALDLGVRRLAQVREQGRAQA
ncbi:MULTISPECIES: hypothetical protein [unclassified Streptomyces]|uniref:hypothetical protein n=1 Tax=unclassified Streptomyces TaxID=2593676 RepID=UPI00224E2B90|nr:MULTISPECIES: hypothetical protein [unclassified Streptomyces]MCX4410093.1 hypothetical protein [Streptomyces sp. NBC_01764]MCX5191868.1 hypothetical protein [Streptomyces sp. NBC_00268]